MKKCFFLFIILPFVILLSACSDTKKEYFPNGVLKSVVHVRDGKYYGKALFYNSSGDLQLECFYKDNLLQGPLIRYFHYLKKKEEQNYDKGNLDGLCTEYYEDGGRLTETTYMNGVLNGPYREYHPGNRIKLQGQYLKGFFTGRWLYFNYSGDIIGDGQFTHGTGRQRSYYDNGKVSHEVHFKNNLKDGEELDYDPSGTVTGIKIFRNDSLIKSIQR